MQVVGTFASLVSARLGKVSANMRIGAARTLRILMFFKVITPQGVVASAANCKQNRGESHFSRRQGVFLDGSSDDTLMRNRVYSWAAVASNIEPCTLTWEFSMTLSGNSETPTNCTSVADMHW